MMKPFLIKTLFVGILLLPVTAGADAFDRVAHELDLTEGQRAAIDTERYQARKQAIQLKAVVAEAQLELQRLIRDPGASETDIDRRIDELAAARAELQKNQVHSRRAMSALLTAEQRTKLEALKLERKERRGDRRDWQRQRHGRRLNARNLRIGAPVRQHVAPPIQSW